jgi:membrane protease YdiL (CAAX protease family)
MTEPVPASATGLRGVFHGARRIRAGWRFALFLVLFLAFGAAMRLAFVAAHVPRPDGFAPSTLLLSEALAFALVLAATLVMGRIERRSLADYGLPLRRAFGRSTWAGFAWGLAAVTAIVAPIAAMRGVHYEGLRYAGAAFASMAALWLASMFMVGLAEEALFRGYALRVLTDGLGFWPASILLSLVFGALHFFGKPFETPVDFASVTLIGLFLCWTLRRTGDLWWAIGFHATFDLAQLGLFAGPNSGNGGLPVAESLLVPAWHGPDWLTGGKLGLEASVFVFPVIAALFLLFPRVYREAKFPPRES